MLALLAAAAASSTVAVMPLRPLGVRADAALALERTLRAEVARLPEVTMVAPDLVAKALRRKPDCIARVSCAASAAASAGARRFISGTVSELGDVFMLDVKLLDARDGRELRRVSHPISGVKDLLIDAVRAAAVELLTPARYAGSLWVEVFAGPTPVPGAELYVDGKLAGRTPLAEPIGALAPGQHTLRVAREGVHDVTLFVDIRFERIAAARIDLARGALAMLGYLTDVAPLKAKAAADARRPAHAADAPLLLMVATPPQRSPWLRVAGWSGLGVGAVSALVAVAFHARAYATAADLNRREQQNKLAPSDVESYRDIDREVKVARALYVVGGTLAAAGAGALLYDRYLDRRASPKSAWRAQPMGAGVMLSRSF